VRARAPRPGGSAASVPGAVQLHTFREVDAPEALARPADQLSRPDALTGRDDVVRVDLLGNEIAMWFDMESNKDLR
jgi:hypothetical protein